MRRTVPLARTLLTGETNPGVDCEMRPEEARFACPRPEPADGRPDREPKRLQPRYAPAGPRRLVTFRLNCPAERLKSRAAGSPGAGKQFPAFLVRGLSWCAPRSPVPRAFDLLRPGDHGIKKSHVYRQVHPLHRLWHPLHLHGQRVGSSTPRRASPTSPSAARSAATSVRTPAWATAAPASCSASPATRAARRPRSRSTRPTASRSTAATATAIAAPAWAADLEERSRNTGYAGRASGPPPFLISGTRRPSTAPGPRATLAPEAPA